MRRLLLRFVEATAYVPVEIIFRSIYKLLYIHLSFLTLIAIRNIINFMAKT